MSSELDEIFKNRPTDRRSAPGTRRLLGAVRGDGNQGNGARRSRRLKDSIQGTGCPLKMK